MTYLSQKILKVHIILYLVTGLYQLHLTETMNSPINYLEVGTLYGGSLLSFAQTFGLHSESKLFCIDPWIDYPEYPEYPEYKGEQEKYIKRLLFNP